MMQRLAAFLTLLPLLAQYRTALPGYQYEFPRDHFNHPDFETEWWYYTGNLKSPDGHRFGFELTFFREAVSRAPQTSSWDVNDVYLAHLALSDVDGRQYLHLERLNRAGPGLAGANLSQSRIWNGNWETRWEGDTQRLQAIADRFTLQLLLTSLKPPVINGRNGVSQKTAGSGRASYYISLTRLIARGELTLDLRTYRVEGTAWMDHEFFTHQLDPSQAGWDWFSLQLNDGSELMLYRLRRKGGGVDPYSAGTYVDPRGHSRFLSGDAFSLEPSQRWTNPDSATTYPLRWRVQVPSLNIELEVSTPLESQEFTGGSHFAPSYWEGVIDVQGESSGHPVKGDGYLEMTGYDHPVQLSR
jgi:predicted secreted hydrolase